MTKPVQIEKEALRMPAIDPGVRIGHVHLKVADLQRALDFYCGVLGFELTHRRPGAAFISAGGYHHHIGLNTWESLGGSPPPPRHHRPLPYRHPLPDPAALADALRRLIAAGIPLEGASDHGVSEALYLRDPDENGVELYWDRPKEQWPRKPDGSLKMFTNPLDLHDLLADLAETTVPLIQLECRAHKAADILHRLGTQFGVIAAGDAQRHAPRRCLFRGRRRPVVFHNLDLGWRARPRCPAQTSS